MVECAAWIANGSFPKLASLRLACTPECIYHLQGSWPAEWGGLTALTELDAGYQQLNGGLPDGLATLLNLKYLRLSGNSFEGNLRRTCIRVFVPAHNALQPSGRLACVMPVLFWSYTTTPKQSSYNLYNNTKTKPIQCKH